MSSLKVAVLSDGGSFYAPRLLADVIESERIEVVAIFVRTNGESRLDALRSTIKASGLRYSFARARALLRLRRHHNSARRSGANWRELPLPTWSDALNTGSPRVVEVPTANSEGFRSTLEATGAEVLLSTFYGEIVDTSTLNVASIGCVNIHPSLLPALRGTNPVFWALAEGLSTTGLTAHEMVKEFDAGGIVCQLSVPVDGGDTHHELYRRIVETASPRLEQALATIGAERSITTVEQDRSLASTFSKPDRHAYASMLANGHRFL